MGDITRSNYPELDKVLWDFHNQKIPAQLAFQMYEKRWKFIDEKHMEQKERRLLAQLTDEYGNGLFMAA
ncbi:hypothetical protein N4G40_01825 [Pantoea eucrina]|uniref:Uncharacterized protein n=1 Tax=Pantoea eucrina TaxID=472693 RepID=A0ABU5LAS9_9GAMM|nr:hypothetical protein [Pantoea eucrina]MDZ7277025.1 hypothetical protein [Pantoea eucrina]